MPTVNEGGDDSFYNWWQLAPLFLFPLLDLVPYLLAGEFAYGWGIGAGQMLAVFAVGSGAIYGYRKLIPNKLSERAWIAVTVTASLLALLIWAGSFISGPSVQAGSAFLFSHLLVSLVAYPLGVLRSLLG